MVVTLIASNPIEKRQARQDGSPIIHIAEHFCDTIQGENYVGYPCTFLRLQFCTLNCVWCDTLEVWRYGNPYSVEEVYEIWKEKGVIDRLKKGQHLVLTGGSPIKQQDSLVSLFRTQ